MAGTCGSLQQLRTWVMPSSTSCGTVRRGGGGVTCQGMKHVVQVARVRCRHLIMSTGIFDAAQEQERRDLAGRDVAFAPDSGEGTG